MVFGWDFCVVSRFTTQFGSQGKQAIEGAARPIIPAKPIKDKRVITFEITK